MASSDKPAAAAAAPPKQIGLPTRMALSAVAGMVAATVCHPLDVVRVHMQVDIASGKNREYRNSLDAITKVFSRYGLRKGLYAGLSAAYLRQWLYGSCRIGIFSWMLSFYKSTHNGVPPSFGMKIMMGMLSGTIGSLVGNPSELALVRMTADSKAAPDQRRNYKGILDCLWRTTKEEGVLALWRGAVPTVLRAAFLSGAAMGITSECKQRLHVLSRPPPPNSGRTDFSKIFRFTDPNGSGLVCVSTVIASVCAAAVSQPFDVVKSRIQNQKIGPDGKGVYKNGIQCALQSIKNEGILVMWRGYTPAFVKLAPYTMISLAVADRLSQFLFGTSAV